MVEMETIQLYAPSGARIIGAVASDGSIREFDYSYDRVSKCRLYVLKNGTALSDDPLMLIDTAGVRWNSTDAELHTLFSKSK